MTDGGYGGSGRMEISGEAARWRIEAPHSRAYIDSEGEGRCVTCDKWLERDCYTLDDHHQAMVREGIFSAQRALDDHAAARKTTP